MGIQYLNKYLNTNCCKGIIYINKIDIYKRVLIPTTNGHPVP